MEATVKVLDWVELPVPEFIPILQQGALLRLPYLESRLREARAQVRAFEEKYTLTLVALQTQGLPDDATYQMHEDFIEWEYWDEEVHKVAESLENVRTILEKIEETPYVYSGSRA